MAEKSNENSDSDKQKRAKILVLFGTRPEAIKCAPVIQEINRRELFETVIVSSSQHRDLLLPFVDIFGLSLDYDLRVMTANQTLNQILAKTISELDTLLDKESPQLIMVQGDTSTTLSGAIAGFNRDIPVAHIEAGLRTGNLRSPFPEEMNRRLTSKLATFHFAPTTQNRQNLLREMVSEKEIFVTGNTIVDALNSIRGKREPSSPLQNLLDKTAGKKRLLLTTHRRESFRKAMRENLEVIRDFVKARKDTCLVFPVHPNPYVLSAANDILGGLERIFLINPLDYIDFIALMENSWLILSDSGGIQEEAPTLGKPVLILRENTERPEAVQCGVAKLVGGKPGVLAAMLDHNYLADSWVKSVGKVQNPFGDGKASRRIVDILETLAK
ncbi:MAG: UDP-N-acetylglucosamine 2-epimerase (non-hydrolyzing) [Pyrinomonadaceae bacterium]|nr:UDP-N-acetylglucosamine 2-epimerase (non-hydrolyzing) [Pyrinomonadaceae bacterium]